ncbi:MAG: hypothetical protein KAR20_16470 [Candidatus Heimdallarchaeota archaeon]|nr:hypothetical protein [Candidatus Heimdallarchaeota archaeon]
MFISFVLANAQASDEEFFAMKHAVSMSYVSLYAIVLLIVIALIINHLRFKKLFRNTLVPFFVLFALHPAWLLRALKLEKASTLEILSYVFLGLAVLWFVVFLFIKKKPVEKPVNAEESK